MSLVSLFSISILSAACVSPCVLLYLCLSLPLSLHLWVFLHVCVSPTLSYLGPQVPPAIPELEDTRPGGTNEGTGDPFEGLEGERGRFPGNERANGGASGDAD